MQEGSGGWHSHQQVLAARPEIAGETGAAVTSGQSSVAKFRKLGGKVSLREKMYTSSKEETASTRRRHRFQIYGQVTTAHLLMVSMQKQKRYYPLLF